MTDAEISDNERYANESFENESDADEQEISEYENEATGSSDDDDADNLPSVKMNENRIKRNNYPNKFASIKKTDMVPFDSASDEEDDVIVGETLVEINTQSMHFLDEVTARNVLNEKDYRLDNANVEARESSEEISEEEYDEEEEELRRIKDMEEKYLQQILMNSPKESNTDDSENLEEKIQKNISPINENETESEHENEDYDDDEAEEEKETEFDVGNALSSEEGILKGFLSNEEDNSNDKASESSFITERHNQPKDNIIKCLDQTELLQLIQSSLKNLKIASPNGNVRNSRDDTFLNENNSPTVDTSTIINSEKIALAVVNALHNAGLKHSEAKTIANRVEQSHELIKEFKESDVKSVNAAKATENAVVRYEGDFDDQKEIEEKKRANNNYPDDIDIYYDSQYDYRITSKTPSSLNSENYIFHANFIKHSTNSIDKFRAKPHPRKSMSFSNERMREIERHNQILLRKILSQKPTYALKPKPSQPSLQKLPSQTNTRLTTSALNRKKQQRQIVLDNQILKRKIETIALRKRPLVS